MTKSLKNLSDFNWFNQPAVWRLDNEELHVVTDDKTDFWQETWYGFHRNSGHVFGCYLEQDFSFQVCIEADFTTLYDQAGLMVLIDDKHWLKAGIEYNDGQPMIGSVLTNELSDWATGIFSGNPKRFWMRITKVTKSLRVQYSTDGKTWPLLRLSPCFENTKYFVGVMCCTPERAGLEVKFTDFQLTEPSGKELHDLS